MSTNRHALDALKRELGAPGPEAFAQLDAGALDALATQLRQARERQARQLDEALTRALEHVPALMRLPVRKILGL